MLFVIDKLVVQNRGLNECEREMAMIYNYKIKTKTHKYSEKKRNS